MQLTVLVDNNPRPGLYSAWGLSIHLDLGDFRVLFDGGPDPRILRHNASRLGIDLRSVDLVVLSHEHSDHYGGLLEVPELSGKPILLPPSSSGHLRESLESSGLVPVGSPGRGELETIWFPDPIPEQSLLLMGDRSVLVTGCSHPGIVRIAEEAVNRAGRLKLLVGGFHLAWAGRELVEDILSRLLEMDIERIAPIHCSGNYIRDLLSEYPGRGLLLTVGSRVEI